MTESGVESRESRKKIKSYRQLLVWQKARLLVKHVYLVMDAMPKEECYGLTGQIKRAVISIPSNIAEGSSRRATPEFIRFINMATGSLAELETQLMLAQDLGFIERNNVSELLSETDEISRMLQGLYNALTVKNARLPTLDSPNFIKSGANA